MSTKLLCNSCLQTKCIIKLCSAECIEEISEKKETSIYRKGQIIFNEGSAVYGIYIINKGKVKVYNTGFNQKQQILRFSIDGDLLGHRGFGTKKYSIGAVALEESTICFIDNALYYRIIKSNIEMLYHIMVFYASELRAAEARMKNLSQMSVREKVAESLQIMSTIFGKNEKEKIMLDAPLTRQEMAEIGGMRPEQFIKELNIFIADKVVSFSKKNIIINKPEVLTELLSTYNKE
jgi:CRP-like cAMP-binding protein